LADPTRGKGNRGGIAPVGVISRQGLPVVPGEGY